MALTLPDLSRSAMADALVGRLDGTGPGSIEIRSGTRPDVNAAATGTLLAEVVLENPAFGAAAAGVATIVDPGPATGVGDGTASWFRALDDTGATVFDGSVSETGGPGDLQLATTTISTGLSIDITGGTITQPSGA